MPSLHLLPHTTLAELWITLSQHESCPARRYGVIATVAYRLRAADPDGAQLASLSLSAGTPEQCAGPGRHE